MNSYPDIMANKKKILFFVQDGVGGAERVSVLFGKSLDMRENEVKFYLIETPSETTIKEFIPAVYQTIYIHRTHPIKLMWQIFNIIRHEKPHIVFSSVMHLNTKILPFRAFFPATRFVIRCENYLYTFSKKQLMRMRLTYQKADAIIAQTQEMADELIKVFHIDKAKVTVLQNPVDTKLIDQKIEEGTNPYPQNEKKHFVASGRFAHQKGFDLLVQAFCEVRKKRNDVDLYIIGDKNYRNGKIYRQIEQYQKEHGLEEWVHCVGFQMNPYVYIKYADCFVLSSRWEGLPNVLTEAQYLGTPAAAFKCIPVIERIVADKVNGYLAENENVESLAAAMLNAIDMGRICSTYSPASAADFVKVCDGENTIRSRRQMKYWIRLDFESFHMEHPLAARFTYGEHWELFSYMKNLRHLEYYTNKPQKHPWDKVLKKFYWLKHRRNCKQKNITISPNHVGAGFHLVHRGFRRIGAWATIGKNCEVLPMVMIVKKHPGECKATIGDNCYLGANTTILGPVVIGHDVTIGAGSVVTKDIPSNCTVAGVPAKIIKYREPIK